MNKHHVCPIHIRIIKHRKVNYIATGRRLSIDYWNFEENKVKKNHPNSTRLNLYLQSILIKYTDETLIAETQDLPINGKRIKEKIVGSKQVSFFEIANELCQKYIENNSIGTYAKATSIIKKLKTYCKGTDLTFEDFNTRFLTKYQSYLATELSNCLNTIGKDFKFFRTVFNYAVNQKLINESLSPFKGYKIKTEQTIRVFLYPDEIAKFKGFNGSDLMNRCRDIVLFQYYSGGIRISDALLLKVKHINNCKINITIRKTGTQLSHGLNDSAIKIVEHYSEGKGAQDYIFGFLPNTVGENDAEAIDSFIASTTSIINRKIKKIAESVGIKKPISTHSFRHSFAINALEKGIPLEQIQMILKHSNIRETQVYARIQNEAIDNTMRNFDKK